MLLTRFESICYFEPVINQDNILCAWLSGCKFFEKFDHEKIKNDCTHVLKKMLNRDDIPLPKSLIMLVMINKIFFIE